MLNLIRTIAKQNKYVLYTRPYELNIWGFRSAQVRPNRFDDEIHVFFKTDAFNWDYHIFKATTDPGTYYLNNPMMPQGTAILKSGQYRDAYSLGLHRGQYIALVQSKKVTVIRDYNRNNSLDFYSKNTASGLFGINIHRAMPSGTTYVVDKFSAGCQVFSSAKDFLQFIKCCERHKSLYGNRFSYTLVDFREKTKARLRKGLITAGLTIAAIGGVYFALKEHKQQKQ